MSKKFSPTECGVAIIFFIFAFVFPIFSTPYQVDNFSNFYVSSILALSLLIIWGFTGIFSFGQAVFYAFGAYVYGIFSNTEMFHFKNNIYAVVASVVICGLVAGILGWFIFYGRISSVFTGLITLCIAKACEIFMIQTSGTEWQVMGVALGGYNGMNGIPPIHIGNLQLTTQKFYYFAVIMTLIIYLILKLVQRSKIGYSLFCVRENIGRSELFGYDVAKIQTLSFAFSGALAALAGTMFSSWSTYVAPSNFSLTTAVTSIVMVAVAGKKNPTAVLVTTVLYCWATQKMSAQGSEYTKLILGVVLILVVMFAPNGIVQALFDKVDAFIEKLIKKKRA